MLRMTAYRSSVSAMRMDQTVPIHSFHRGHPTSLGYLQILLLMLVMLAGMGAIAAPILFIMWLMAHLVPADGVGLLFHMLYVLALLPVLISLKRHFAEKFELCVDADELRVQSSKGKSRAIPYSAIRCLQLFEDEWDNGESTVHWRGVILSLAGDSSVVLDLGSATRVVAQAIGERTSLNVEETRKVWPYSFPA